VWVEILVIAHRRHWQGTKREGWIAIRAPSDNSSSEKAGLVRVDVSQVLSPEHPNTVRTCLTDKRDFTGMVKGKRLNDDSKCQVKR
jgi:hypothetical protein